MTFTLDSGLLSGLIGALLFGVLYNQAVQRLRRSGQSEGYTAFLVAVGVAATLGFSLAVLPLAHILTLLLFFVATGTPMILGSTWAYIERRRHGLNLIRDLENRHDD